VQATPWPEGTAGGSRGRARIAPGAAATTGPDRAAAGPGAPKSARQTANVASLRPTAGSYRRRCPSALAAGARGGPPGSAGNASQR